MSYDPNSNQNPEPNYSRPDYANPDSYATPNAPYGSSNPYETPSTSYGAPPNTPNMAYGTPPNMAYGAPETPYGAPPRAPRPLGEAIRELPNQYIRTITKPGTAVFAEEQGKAAWNIIWVQLIVLAVISAFIGLGALNVSLSTSTTISQQVVQSIRSYSTVLTVLFFILTPIGFFISTGIYHLIAKAFGGRGTFLAYCYCYLLFGVPLGIVGGLLGLIPFIGSFIAFAVSIYQIVLLVYMTMAVHRLRGGRATLAVLVLPIVVIVLGIIVGIIGIAALAGARHA